MTTVDLRAVDDLCRLVVVARRLGCRVHLEGGDRELWRLLELAGVSGIVAGCPGASAPVLALAETRAARWSGTRARRTPLP